MILVRDEEMKGNMMGGYGNEMGSGMSHQQQEMMNEMSRAVYEQPDMTGIQPKQRKVIKK